MPTYQFYLSEFKITDTRSHINDTLIAGLGVAVNGALAGVQVAQMGDFDNGTFLPWQHKLNAVNNVVANPTDRISFTFQMYNNGHDHHPNEAELTKAITEDLTAIQLESLSTVSPLDDDGGEDPDGGQTPVQTGEITGSFAITGEEAAAFFTGGLYELFKAVFKDCDGIVAGAALSFVGQDLENQVNAAPGKVLKVTYTFNAKANGYGEPCNSSGSNYLVTWIIQHQP